MDKIMTKTSLLGAALALAAVMLVARTTPLQAQVEYHPITDGCIWSVSNEKYKTAGDTVLNGKTYMKVFRQVGYDTQPFEFSLEDAEYFAALRDDPAEKKVYAYLPAGTTIYESDGYSDVTTDTAMEVLLYDFSLNTGDTVCFYTIGSKVVKIIATRVEAVNLYVGVSNQTAVMHPYSAADTVVYLSDNSARTQILLEGISLSSKPCVWIEGIGSVRGFDEGIQMNLSDYDQRILLCFTDGTGVSYQTGFDLDENPNDCYSTGFGGSVETQKLFGVNVYPNPTSDLLHIELSGTEIANVTLYDLQGRIIYSPNSPNSPINLRNVAAGVYVLRVTGADGHEYHQKIVKK